MSSISPAKKSRSAYLRFHGLLVYTLKCNAPSGCHRYLHLAESGDDQRELGAVRDQDGTFLRGEVGAGEILFNTREIRGVYGSGVPGWE
ncbi:MAG: hypothetical protein MZV63_46175 [Marinilabiliales bacterium]|nr:hypothetical protein [Marinilabiliales bacterium]